MVLHSWTAHPAKRRPRDLVLVVAVLLLTMGAVLGSAESLVLTALSAVILTTSVASFLLPTRYTITDVGVSERRLWRVKARHFRDLRRLQIGSGAALLSPFARKNWLDRHRGMLIMFDGTDRQTVIDVLRERMGQLATDREG
ncbi:MAG: hypothetical protein MJE77_34470 [Proteobacteria bacterium]|nr:hypothetical protein [Pseudomonadota bacterium]